jgi:hypothetical protein
MIPARDLAVQVRVNDGIVNLVENLRLAAKVGLPPLLIGNLPLVDGQTTFFGGINLIEKPAVAGGNVVVKTERRLLLQSLTASAIENGPNCFGENLPESSAREPRPPTFPSAAPPLR